MTGTGTGTGIGIGIDWAAGHGWLCAGGHQLEWAAFGPPPGERPVLVLLHEGLGCVALWRDVPRNLAEATGCAVLAYSRAGYGQSDPAALPRPLDYMTVEARGALSDVLVAVNAPRAILIGHSDGATIALLHAGLCCHDSVAGLVAMAPHVFTEPTGLAEIAAAREAYETGALRSRLARYHRDPDCAFRGWNDAWLAPGFRDWNVTPALAGIEVPCLVIQGRDDPYGTPAQVEAVRGGCGAEVLLLEGCRHAPHLECPDITLAAMSRFVAQVSTGGLAS